MAVDPPLPRSLPTTRVSSDQESPSLDLSRPQRHRICYGPDLYIWTWRLWRWATRRVFGLRWHCRYVFSLHHVIRLRPPLTIIGLLASPDTPASKTQVFLSSGFICLCQLVCVLVSYETGHNPPIETNVQHLDDHLAPTTTEPAASDLSPSSDSSRPQPAIPRTDDSTREPRTDFLAPRKRTSLRRRRPTTEVEEANGLLACEEEGVSLGAARSGRELHEEDEVEEEKDGSELPVLELRLWSSVRRLLSSSPAARDDDASTSSLSSEATTATVAVG